MYRMIYIAADKNLPQIPWDENNPGFHVTPLTEVEKDVAKQFTKSYVFYAGSHEGCGCGFSFGQMPIDDEEDEKQDKAARKSNEALKQYLIENLGSIEVFACWDGDQTMHPKTKMTLDPHEISGETFDINEPVLFELKNNG